MPHPFSLAFHHRSLWSFENEVAHAERKKLDAPSNNTTRVRRMHFMCPPCAPSISQGNTRHAIISRRLVMVNRRCSNADPRLGCRPPAFAGAGCAMTGTCNTQFDTKRYMPDSASRPFDFVSGPAQSLTEG